MKTTTTTTMNLVKTLLLAVAFFFGTHAIAQCNSSFTYSINANGNVSFQSTSTPTNANCYWNFGNNQTSTLTSPSITYTANGTYVVNLFIWAAPTCSTGSSQTITITNAATSTCNLNAGFTYSVGSNGFVTFNNTTTGASTLASYYWTNNNNYMSSAFNPSLTLSNGWHNVCLYVSDSLNNCYDSYCDSFLVNNSNCNLSANFNYTIGSNGNVSFASTSTGTTTNTTYNWWINSSTYTGPAANHTFQFNGWYTVCLYISDSTNTCTDSYCDYIYVNTAANSASCNANFTYSIGANGNVTFTSTSTGTTSTTNYYWSFNNSAWSNGPTTSATFTNYFNYVCLTIYDSTSWCYSTYCDSIIIPTNPCNASVNFVMIQDSTQALTWWAYANYPSNVTNAVWSWGDNTTSQGFYPSHTYSASGFYNICVTITVSCAGTASYCANTFISRSADASASSALRHVNVANAAAPTNVKVNTATEPMKDIMLYPNPAKDLTKLKVNMNQSGEVTLSVYEITGKLVQQSIHAANEGVNTLDIPLNTLNKGMYFVTINSGNAKKTVRLIKE
jgi:hypothetical protein